MPIDTEKFETYCDNSFSQSGNFGKHHILKKLKRYTGSNITPLYAI